MKLENKVCVVTGGVQGIGRAIVEEYAREGARVAVADVNGEGAEAYAEELRARGIEACGYRCDVSVRDDVAAVADAVERDLGRCEVLVCNAGIALMGPSLDFPEGDKNPLAILGDGLLVRGLRAFVVRAIAATGENGQR